jgi:hypothetical protein
MVIGYDSTWIRYAKHIQACSTATKDVGPQREPSGHQSSRVSGKWTAHCYHAISQTPNGPPAVHPAGLQKLALAADLVLGSSTGACSMSVPINQPPSCTGGPASCLTITTLADTFPSAAFTASTQGWDDSDALQFVFGTLPAPGRELKPRSAPGLATSFTFRLDQLTASCLSFSKDSK